MKAPADPKCAYGGYFRQDKHSATPSEGKEFSKGTADDKVEEHTFDLIMRQKEKLLDEAVPLRFLFSHLALREDWDNPSVLQIYALREAGAERACRLVEIGRLAEIGGKGSLDCALWIIPAERHLLRCTQQSRGGAASASVTTV